MDKKTKPDFVFKQSELSQQTETTNGARNNFELISLCPNSFQIIHPKNLVFRKLKIHWLPEKGCMETAVLPFLEATLSPSH